MKSRRRSPVSQCRRARTHAKRIEGREGTKGATRGGTSLVWSAGAALLLGLGCAGCKEAAGATSGQGVTSGGEVELSVEEIHQGGIKVEPLSEQEIDDTLVTSSRVTFEDIKIGHVFSPVTGRVARIDVKLGALVKAGQTLAVIESPDVSLASSDVAKADADLIAAEHDLQRERALLNSNATSQKDYEAAEDAYRRARAEKQRAAQRAFLFRSGSVDAVTEGYSLVSPIDGEVLARNLTLGTEIQGQYSGGSQELFTVGELDEVWVLADIYEVDIARVQKGAKCLVRTVAQGDHLFEGKVDWVAGMLDATTRTAKARCTLSNRERLLKPDMYATATISVAPHKVPAIPKTAILHLGAQSVVFVDHGPGRDGKHAFEREPITADEALDGRWVPVLHGLNVGDSVVTEGAETLESKI
jgi:cobalt-zinc-cadmium efflux system membrane fusion protein